MFPRSSLVSLLVSVNVCVCFVSLLQPDDEESREEQEGEEGGVTFIAHVPVPSQKEVRLTCLSHCTFTSFT